MSWSKPRENKFTLKNQIIEFIPFGSVGVALYLTLFLYVISGENLTIQLIIQAVTICLSLSFGFAYNLNKAQSIELNKFNVGKVVYIEEVHQHRIMLILFQFLGALFLTIPWIGASIGLSHSLLPAFLTYLFLWIWLSLLYRLMPFKYYVTNEGIWFRKITNHYFIYFDDMEYICYDEDRTRFWLITGSSKWTSIINCNGFIILSLKPERKLKKENQRQPITVIDPKTFLKHIPNNLLVNGCENVST